MSEQYVQLIPYSVDEVPKSFDDKRIVDIIVASNILVDDIKVTKLEEIQFIDCGDSLTSVRCNHCGSDILNDLGDYMSQSFQSKFENRKVIMKCCNVESTLEDLVFDMPCGFARYIIELFNPEKEIEDSLIAELEKVLGIRLKCIIAHY